MVERVLGKDEVGGSNPLEGSEVKAFCSLMLNQEVKYG